MSRFEHRIQTEVCFDGLLRNLAANTDTVDGIKMVPSAENKRLIDIYLDGPEGTPYEGGQFHVQLFLPDKYPIRAPLAYFVTKIWHPNIDYLGRICLDTLGKKWSAAFLIDKVALSLLVLLQSPNADDPLDINIAEQFRNNPEAAKKKAAQWTKLFAQKKV